MTKLTLAQAAAMTGLSRSTLNRATKSGKLSAQRDEAGAIHIDASELARVFPVTSPEPVQRRATVSHEQPRDEGVAVLETKVAMLTDQLAQANDTVADLRTRLDWAQGRLALTDQTQPQGTGQPGSPFERLAAWLRRPRGEGSG